MKSLLGTRINKPICVDPNYSEWMNSISNSLFHPSKQHRVTQVSDGCRGPPEVLRTACNGLLSHRLKPLSKHETGGDNPSVDERTFMLAIINDLKPKDPVERMLAVQMTTTHVATIRAGSYAPIKAISKTLYRGGGFCTLLSHGMSWTEDRDMAVFFAKRQDKTMPIVLATKTSANRPFEVAFV
jgi:hypothetical protein